MGSYFKDVKGPCGYICVDVMSVFFSVSFCVYVSFSLSNEREILVSTGTEKPSARGTLFKWKNILSQAVTTGAVSLFRAANRALEWVC